MDWFDWFIVTGTIFFVTQIIDFVIDMYQLARMYQAVRHHDQYCEDCADELMAETFKSMRDGVERDDR